MQELHHPDQQQGEEGEPTGCSTRKNRPSNLQHAPTSKEQIQKSLRYYIAVETAWHVTLFATCYRYRPLLRLSRTAAGKRVLERVQQWTKRRSDSSTANTNSNSWWQRLQNKETFRRIPGGQRSVVAASEWFVLNKTIGIILLPAKLVLAGWISQQVEQYREDYQDK